MRAKRRMGDETAPGSAAASAKWATLPYHRGWLVEQASRLFDFFEARSIDPSGGFFSLDDLGKSIGRNVATGALLPRELHVTTRMVHCFAIARLMGRPGADRFIDHGMKFLWNG